MIVPRYWAEGRVQYKGRVPEKRRQLTVKRFGWSNSSLEEAQQMADARAAEALEQILSGDERLPRQEPKVPYNGAEGVPIREEIIEQRGETVLTRNRYGALCLNTPDIAFIDIDRKLYVPRLFVAILLTGTLVLASILLGGDLSVFKALILVLLAFFTLMMSGAVWQMIIAFFGGTDRQIRRRVEAFFQKNPQLSASFYETPNGYRLLLTQSPLAPDSVEVMSCFQQLHADREYVAMCLRQRCFRARVSPKPWRIGGDALHKVVGAVWPLDPERLAKRMAWVKEYESISKGYASCRFIATLGDGLAHPNAAAVRDWHDALSGAHSGLPIA